MTQQHRGRRAPALLAASLLLLAGCGYKGPLVLPETDQTSQASDSKKTTR